MPPKKASASTKEKAVTKSKAPPKTKIAKLKVQEEDIQSAEPAVTSTRSRRAKNIVEDLKQNTVETNNVEDKKTSKRKAVTDSNGDAAIKKATKSSAKKKIVEEEDDDDEKTSNNNADVDEDVEPPVKDLKKAPKRKAAQKSEDVVDEKQAKITTRGKKAKVESTKAEDPAKPLKRTNRTTKDDSDETEEPVATKPARKTSKKTIKDNVDESEESVAKPAAKKTTRKASKVDDVDETEEPVSKPAAKKATKKPSKVDEDDETEEPVTKPAAKKTTKKTSKVDDVDETEEPVSKPAAKKATKKPSKVDEDDETEEPVTKPAAKKTTKKTSNIDDVDETEEVVTKPENKTIKKSSREDDVDETEEPIKEPIEDDDDEEAEKPVTKPVAKKRAKKNVKEDDNDSGVEESSTKATKKASKATEKKPMNKTDTDWENINFTCEAKSNSGQSSNFHITAWNVNGIRAWVKKGGLDILQQDKPDIFCVQETKCTSDKLPEELAELPDYKAYWCSSDKEGYAGVGILSKVMPIEVHYGIESPEHDVDGRCITAEYKKFYLVNVYVPNAGRNLVTLPKRLDWNIAFKAFVKKLGEKKPVIICGDMNVAHAEIDLANPKQNTKNAGFTAEEREGMSDFLSEGFVDTFRQLYPDKPDSYTFWNYIGKSRSRNVGWRIDYFIVTENFCENVVDNIIHSEVMGSDHCPISLHLNI